MTYEEYFEKLSSKIDYLTYMLISSNYWDNVESFSNILVNIVVIIGGVVGLLYYKKLKERQSNAVFSYLTQLEVRLKQLQLIYLSYEDYLMERFIPDAKRVEDVNATLTFINKIVKEFANNALETLNFLRKSQEQMPASKDWVVKYDLLIEFLFDAYHLSIENYFKWMSDDEKVLRKQYAEKHKKNLEEILNDIKNEQEKITDKLFKK